MARISIETVRQIQDTLDPDGSFLLENQACYWAYSLYFSLGGDDTPGLGPKHTGSNHSALEQVLMVITEPSITPECLPDLEHARMCARELSHTIRPEVVTIPVDLSKLPTNKTTLNALVLATKLQDGGNGRNTAFTHRSPHTFVDPLKLSGYHEVGAHIAIAAQSLLDVCQNRSDLPLPVIGASLACHTNRDKGRQPVDFLIEALDQLQQADATLTVAEAHHIICSAGQLRRPPTIAAVLRS